MNCMNRGSRVCDRELQKQEASANAIPPGQGRREAMEAILDLAYERVYFIPFFQVQYVYGLSEHMEWEPYYAPRLRGNTMWFSQ